jgi:hypothetical protein
MIMKLKLLILLGALLAAVMSFTVPAASASSSPHPAPHVSRQSHSPHARPDPYAFTLCLNTAQSQCLNLTNCNLDEDVQTWNFSTGGTCSQDWYVSAIGHVGAGGFNPFWCGDDLNARYYGDVVFLVIYATGSSGTYVPESTGDEAPVYVFPETAPYDLGYWVAPNSSLTDTTLIDATTSCTYGGQEQYVYAGCLGNGCRVREAHYPPSLWFWAWLEQEF